MTGMTASRRVEEFPVDAGELGFHRRRTLPDQTGDAPCSRGRELEQRCGRGRARGEHAGVAGLHPGDDACSARGERHPVAPAQTAHQAPARPPAQRRPGDDRVAERPATVGVVELGRHRPPAEPVAARAAAPASRARTSRGKAIEVPAATSVCGAGPVGRSSAICETAPRRRRGRSARRAPARSRRRRPRASPTARVASVNRSAPRLRGERGDPGVQRRRRRRLDGVQQRADPLLIGRRASLVRLLGHVAHLIKTPRRRGSFPRRRRSLPAAAPIRRPGRRRSPRRACARGAAARDRRLGCARAHGPPARRRGRRCRQPRARGESRRAARRSPRRPRPPRAPARAAPRNRGSAASISSRVALTCGRRDAVRREFRNVLRSTRIRYASSSSLRADASAQQPRPREHASEGLLDEILGVVRRAAQRPRGAVEAVDVIRERLRIKPRQRRTAPPPTPPPTPSPPRLPVIPRRASGMLARGPDERRRRPLRPQPERAAASRQPAHGAAGLVLRPLAAAPASCCGSRISTRSARAASTRRASSPTSRASGSTGTAAEPPERAGRAPSRRVRAAARRRAPLPLLVHAAPRSAQAASAPHRCRERAARSASAPTPAPAATLSARERAPARARRRPGGVAARRGAAARRASSTLLAGTTEAVVDDFVVWRADPVADVADPAYNLAVVVDDADQGVGEVVRGDDLLETTPRQILLARLLGLAGPALRARAARARPRRPAAGQATGPRGRAASRKQMARPAPRGSRWPTASLTARASSR